MKISVQELLIVLAIVIIIFGPKQIPKLVKMFKKGAASVKEGLDSDEEEVVTDTAEKVKTASKKAAVQNDTDEKG